MCNPSESEKKLIDMIRKRGSVSIGEALAFERTAGLYFGPEVDAADVLYENQRWGVIRIDSANNIIEMKNGAGPISNTDN